MTKNLESGVSHFDVKGHEYEKGLDNRGHSRCNFCNRISMAKYQRELQAFIREELNKVRIERGCAFCGYKAHPAALQFDHIIPEPLGRRKKRTKLPQHKAGLKKFLEDSNIQVLCANCHNIKTRENGDYKSRSNG